MGFSLTQLADEDVIDIYIYGAGQFGRAQADTYQGGLEDALNFIGRHPQASRRVPELGSEVRAYSYRMHIILYEPLGEGVLILRVRSAREDWLTIPE